MQNETYPIFITVYNRINHLKQCINSLLLCPMCEQTTLYISSDAAYSTMDEDVIKSIRTYIKELSGFKEIILLEWPVNNGPHKCIELSREIIFSKHSGYIYLEDDNIVAPSFLQYMNYNLNFWKDNDKIGYICGYFYPLKIESQYDVLFLQEFNAWGYGLWKHKHTDVFSLPKKYFDSEKMKKFKKVSHSSYYIVRADLNLGKIYGDGRRAFTLVKNDQYAVFPKKSLIKNIGHDGSGCNCGTVDLHQNEIVDMTFYPTKYPTDIYIDNEVSLVVTNFRSYSFLKRIRIYLGRIYKKMLCSI